MQHFLYIRADAKKFQNPCFRDENDTESIASIEQTHEPNGNPEYHSEEEYLEENFDLAPYPTYESNVEEEEQPCCCSIFKQKLYSIASSMKNILAAISILALVKNLLSLIIFLYDVASKFRTTFCRTRNALKNQ